MRSLKGGDAKLQAVPIESYGFEYGGNESENAAKMLSAMADKQNSLNNTLSGGRGRRLKRGGSNEDGIVAPQDSIVAPQFAPVGPNVSNQTANSAAYLINSTLINATNNAANDEKIYTGSQNGGKNYKHRKNKSRKRKKSHKRVCRGKYCKKSKSKKSRKHYK